MILVSILIPVGFEYEGIEGCLQSLVDKTEDPERVEVLVKLDDGDEKNLNIVESFKIKLPHLRIIIMDGSKGYADLHKYTNRLAQEAQGIFLWWWSDEVRMITQNWDREFINCTSYQDKIAKFSVNLLPLSGEKYPIITKKWVEITGHWCQHPSIDSWVNTVSEPLLHKGFLLIHKLNINIEDETSVYQAGMKKGSARKGIIPSQFVRGWDWEEVQKEVRQDAKKLKQYIKNHV